MAESDSCYQSDPGDSCDVSSQDTASDSTDEVDTEVRENVWKALDVLKGLGAHVEEVSVPMLNLGGVLYTTLAMPEGASSHAEVLRTRHTQIRKPIRTMFYANSLLPAYVINDALKAKALLRQELLDTYQRFDVLASPNNTTPAPLKTEDRSYAGA